MAREDDQIRERGNSIPPSHPILSTNHVVYVKDVVINALRDMFSRDAEYTYIRENNGILPDFENPNLGVVITDVYSYEVVFLPAITVRVNSSNLVPISFNQNHSTLDYQRDGYGQLVHDNYGRPIPIYQEFAGLYKTSLTIGIATWTPLDREKLVTKVAIFFQHLLRDQLSADFGFFAENVSVGGESEQEYSNDYIFSQTVNVEALTQWTNRIPLGEELLAINLQIVGDMTENPPLPTKKDIEESSRVDWLDEIRIVPDLDFEDALLFDVAENDFFLTEDWLTVLSETEGLTIEDVILQINGDPSRGEALIEKVELGRQIAARAVEFKVRGKPSMVSGSPGDGLRWKMQDGSIVFGDNSVLLTNGLTIEPNGTAITRSGIIISPDNTITSPNNIDMDSASEPFTALSMENLTAYNFFLILLYAKTAAGQSIMSLNSLIDEYVTQLEPAQVTILENIRTQINAIYQLRLLRGQE